MATTSNNSNISNKVGTNIFDEIQQNFLKVLNNNNTINENESTTFDCLSSAFFLPPTINEEPDGEPQLYAVEQGELHPISLPFMIPGIYKKVDANAFKKPSKNLEHSNVFLTESETHGRIVRNTDFHKFYVCEEQKLNEMQCEQQPRKVLLLKGLEQEAPVVDAVHEVKSETSEESPKKWDALSKLAYNILKLSSCDHTVIINRKRNEIVRTEKSTNQKTIYCFIEDEDIGVQPSNEIKTGESTKSFKKLGRPRKRQLETVAKETVTNKRLKQQVTATTKSKQMVHKKPIVCSRFGRVLKSVKHDLTTDKLDNSFESTPSLIANLKDKDYVCNLKYNEITKNAIVESAEQPPVPLATSSPTKPRRHVPPNSICPTCKKIFLGRRLKRHFVQHPDHMKPPTPPPPPVPLPQQMTAAQEEISLFRFLISKLQKSNLNEDQRADLFLHELNDLVKQLQLRSSRLIRNTSGLHFVSARTARVLGIPEGQYALDMSAIDAPPEPELNFDMNALNIPSTNTRSLDYTALSLDDTLTDEAAQKLNLSAGGKLLPPSEESLLRAVDDLVPPTSISKLVSTNLLNRPVNSSTSVSTNAIESLVPHYDHASDNAVEAVTMKEITSDRRAPPLLDLAVDFFQFKTN